MKKLFLLSTFLLLCTLSFAQVSTIKGYMKTPKVTEISLFTIHEGNTVRYATTNLADDGSFAFTFKTPHEGFYVVGVDQNLGEQAPVYLKKGDNAEVTLSQKTITFSNNNTSENKILGEWCKMSNSLKQKSIYFMGSNSIFSDFFPDLAALAPQAKEFAKKIKTQNIKFNELMKEVVQFDIDLYALNFLKTPRTAHPTPEEISPYYSTIVKENYFKNDNVLNTLYGARLLGMYGEYAAKVYDNDAIIKYFSTDVQKGVYLASKTYSMKTYEKFIEFQEKYGKYMCTPTLKKTMEDLGAKLYDTRAGGVAADFTYPDVNGEMVSLSDFKGKVVVVDVWATWCGPCKKEFPALISLEKEFHNNKDIVFLGVSVDEDKDKQKWLDMIKAEGLGGVQLFASGWSKITKDYKITGIPRFMIFSKDGTIYSVNAPRPSSSELKPLLIKLLGDSK